MSKEDKQEELLASLRASLKDHREGLGMVRDKLAKVIERIDAADLEGIRELFIELHPDMEEMKASWEQMTECYDQTLFAPKPEPPEGGTSA